MEIRLGISGFVYTVEAKPDTCTNWVELFKCSSHQTATMLEDVLKNNPAITSHLVYLKMRGDT